MENSVVGIVWCTLAAQAQRSLFVTLGDSTRSHFSYLFTERLSSREIIFRCECPQCFLFRSSRMNRSSRRRAGFSTRLPFSLFFTSSPVTEVKLEISSNFPVALIARPHTIILQLDAYTFRVTKYKSTYARIVILTYKHTVSLTYAPYELIKKKRGGTEETEGGGVMMSGGVGLVLNVLLNYKKKKSTTSRTSLFNIIEHASNFTSKDRADGLSISFSFSLFAALFLQRASNPLPTRAEATIGGHHIDLPIVVPGLLHYHSPAVDRRSASLASARREISRFRSVGRLSRFSLFPTSGRAIGTIAGSRARRRPYRMVM
ncbi:uncharacterized protein LOC105834097 isoform X1 [Monomorium pharaonis]|uniref:uncharacterized protein LOC105834097 isoform X1 n=1 Tax=Monomorium pharaonis TaxID=307658 RepID=UPI001746186A|nr:uncharacterized protein LOC105834097 isoform X1 [Monomorium pharaonis]